MLNKVLIGVLVALGFTAILLIRLGLKKEVRDVEKDKINNSDQLMERVKHDLLTIVSEDTYLQATSDVEYQQLKRKKAVTEQALLDCVYGIDAYKIIVQSLIRSIILGALPEIEDLDRVGKFTQNFIPPNVKFEILLMYFKKYKEYGKDALPHLIRKYGWDQLKYVIEDGTQGSFVVTVEDINYAYRQEDILNENADPEFLKSIMADVLTVLIYQKYKGFGCVDTIQEMNIEGINIGTSGSILYTVGGGGVDSSTPHKAINSIWVYYDGKPIHFRFLSFGTPEECKRVVQGFARCGKPGALTERKGHVITTMWNMSRVMAMRTSQGEYWAAFIRKFSVSNKTLEDLYDKVDKQGNHIHGNAQLVINMIKVLMRCYISTAFTGQQGTGKTTGMKAAFRYMDPTARIRLLETAFEMYLRELYPERNIYTAQETPYNSITSAQNAFKKSDGTYMVVGEVASDELAAAMLETGRIASKATYFSSHHTTSDKLVDALATSLVTVNNVPYLAAIGQVLSVVKVDVHYDFDPAIGRYISRVTEIVPLPTLTPYPEVTPGLEGITEMLREWGQRTTDRKTFETRDLIVFDKATRSYKAVNWFSDEMHDEIIRRCPDQYKNWLKDYVLENWG